MSDNVRNMFAEISSKYDFMNDLLSFGIHHKWRKKAVKLSGASSGMSVLDCATGTGDLAIEFKRVVGNNGNVIGTDFCAEMLEFAPPKAEKEGLHIKFEIADVMNLQYEDNAFDISSISFGIRNVDDTLSGLKEMARVIKPGGKVVVIEFGQPKGIFSLFYKIYSKILMPLLGLIFAKARAAYEYLPQTASKYPCREDFTQIMDKTSLLKNNKYFTLTFGIAYIYIGEKI